VIYPPSLKDCLGLQRSWKGTEWAQKAGSTAIPNNETIVVLNWARHKLTATGMGSKRYVGVGPCESVGGERASVMRQDDTLYLGAYGAAWQQLPVAIPDESDHLWALVIDRDNGQLEAWLDSAKANSAALTQDPDLTANNQIQLNDSTGDVYSDTHWAGAVFSLTPGATPTQAQWAEILGWMADPENGVHPLLEAAIGTHDALWRYGEGIYGATTIENERNPGTDDLTLQGGLKVEDIRTRCMVPVRQTEKTFYNVEPGYTATTPATGFGFTASDPIVVRFMPGDLRGMGYGGHTLLYLVNAAWSHRFMITGNSSPDQVSLRIVTAGVHDFVALKGDQLEGGDIWMTADGTAREFLLNGQEIGEATAAGAVNLSGNCTAGMNPVHGPSLGCMVRAWQMSSLPATLKDEIRECVMNPEKDPPSLTGKRVDFPLRSDLLGAGDAWFNNQGLGGGIMNLSAARSTSCREFIAGWNP